MPLVKMTPPPGSILLDGAPVVSVTRAPDGRFYVARVDAATVLVDGEELAARTEVVEA